MITTCMGICQKCKKRCLIRRNDNDGYGFYGCFDEAGYKLFILDFSSIVGHIFALSRTEPCFVNPVMEFPELVDIDYARKFAGLDELIVTMDDEKFFQMVQKTKCILLPEMKMCEWNRKKK